MKTRIEFNLIKIGEDSYTIDPNSFAMDGKIGWNYLEEFLWKETDWYAEVWNDENNEKLDSCCRQVIMEVWLDSDDYRSWIDFKVLANPNPQPPKTEQANKGFFISDEDLEIFKEWIKKPDSVRQILENHYKVLDACKALERVNEHSHKLLTTPFNPVRF